MIYRVTHRYNGKVYVYKDKDLEKAKVLASRLYICFGTPCTITSKEKWR